MDSEEELYGRNRYYSPMFQVLARTGIAIGLLTNEFGSPKGQKISVQTGLPPKYRTKDTPILKEILAEKYEFGIQIGNGPWQNFSFTLHEDDIYVMLQWHPDSLLNRCRSFLLIVLNLCRLKILLQRLFPLF